ncbi:MAG TPA: NAD(P)-binding domain-containing protein [Bacteroidota bacterium]|nr:NAD(P)-binding domain-containing protein [Bacteroidota bacterium]
MNIGILGTGDVARSLAAGFLRLGHAVRLGTRDPKSEKLAQWLAGAGKGAGAVVFAEAAAFGDVVVLATLWSGTENALKLAGQKGFAGKVVIDATNPLVFRPGEPPALALGHTDSGGEQVQRWLPQSRVVKCFNMVGHAHMVSPSFPGGPPDMFFCGIDAEAKETVAKLLTQLGWPSTDLGGIEYARVLEPLCILWVAYGMRTGGWNHALKMLRK